MPAPVPPAGPIPPRWAGVARLLAWAAAGAAAVAPGAGGLAERLTAASFGPAAVVTPVEALRRFLLFAGPLCGVGAAAGLWAAVRTRSSPEIHRRLARWGWRVCAGFWVPALLASFVVDEARAFGYADRWWSELSADVPWVGTAWVTAFWWGSAAALLAGPGSRGRGDAGCHRRPAGAGAVDGRPVAGDRGRGR